jgi:HEAT repeat protein
VIDKPGALADPRWILVADDSANPLSAPPPADSNSEAGSSLLNSRMGGRWRPASAQSDTAHVAPPPDRSHRWRHPGLELLMAQSAEQRPDLHIAIQSKDPVVATNAAILLSRRRDPAAFEPLLRAIRADSTNSWQRRAAVEAFAELGQPNVVEALRRAIDEQGRFDGDAARSYQADLHGELLHGLAHAEGAMQPPPLGPDGEPRFAAALSSPVASVRREALAALANPWSGPLPANIVRYVGDADSSVRRAALHALAVRRHPEAIELLRQALLDQDLIVRLSAVADLGRLGAPEAIGQLRQMATQGTELIRAAAVAALIEAGDNQIVSTAMADKSWQVRRALVPILNRPQGPRPTELAERLVADVNSDIGAAAILAIGRWPLAESGPILLTAMDDRSYLTRKSAASQLAKLWPPATEFEIEATATRRASELEQLRQKWREQFPATAGAAAPAAIANAPASAARGTTTAEFEKNLAEVQRLLDQMNRPITVPEGCGLLGSLVAFGPDLPELLRRATQSSGRPLPEAIYSEALPAVSREFATIQRLASSDVQERRQAADAIKTETFRSGTTPAAQKLLGDLALERLVALMIREADPLVLSTIIEALSFDDREPATRLACSALSHPAAEVRRLACDHFGMHPDSRNAALLAKSLTDPNATVVAAAVRAMGRLPSLDDPRPLEKILAADDHALRVEAAEALARFGFPAGNAALERLGYDAAPNVRRSAAAAMGRISDRSFVPVLIHLLDDRPEVAKAALESLPRAAGRDLPPVSALAIEPKQSPIERWKDWYRAGLAAPSAQ